MKTDEKSICTHSVGYPSKLISQLLEKINLHKKNTGFDSPELSFVATALELLEQNYKIHHKLDFYLNELNTNKVHINKIFRKYTGKTFYELIQDRIHMEAILLLKCSHLSIKEITFQLGICNQPYFCECFKKYTGMNPGQYRRNFLKANSEIHLIKTLR